MSSLDLALIGNCSYGALINAMGEVVWACMPRFDSDPVFCSLLRARDRPDDFGFYAIDLLDVARAEQHYLTNTAVLVTRLYDARGGAVEITDFALRFKQFDRFFHPVMLVRQIRPVAGSPRICIRLRPAYDYGKHRPGITFGSNHVRYVAPDIVLRLTTDASLSAVIDETPFVLDTPLTLILGPDETVQGGVSELGRRYAEETQAYWREWVRYLGIPFEWQDAVIRAAITLKLNAYDDTGAIIAAMTTSIPEAPNSGRTWDYRFCWLRDSYFVVNALNRLNTTLTMERYLRYIINITANRQDSHLQPVYRINGQANLGERIVDSLPGYRGMGPVRAGNAAYQQIQYDVYGSAILAATHVFFDRRISRPGDKSLFHSLESLGEMALQAFDKPDAGPWELRGTRRVHTFSNVMCWVACDRLSKIATKVGLDARADHWRHHADRLHEVISVRAWSPRHNTFVTCFDGEAVDASLLLLHEMGLVGADDPRFAGTVAAIERRLRRGNFIFRYLEQDDFGIPENAFIICTFWYIDALAALGRCEEARALFETLLACRNHHGLLSEDIDPNTRELWGNFAQTYSMVGLINSAMRLSKPWEEAF